MEDPALVWKGLQASEEEQNRSGSIIELARTWLEMARHKLRLDDSEGASHLALSAWERLSGFSEELFPEDLKHLLDPKKIPGRRSIPQCPQPQDLIGRFLDIMEEIVPGTDLDRFLHRVLSATGRFFGAERGGVFWFNLNDRSRRPLLRASYSLTKEEVIGSGFRQELNLIIRAFKTRQPQVSCAPLDIWVADGGPGTPSLCIPFEVRGQACILVYHDSPSMDESLGSIDSTVLERIARQLASHIERIWDYCKLLDEKALFTSRNSLLGGGAGQWEIKSSSLIVRQLLDRADRVANSEASVLILGETGVGKELPARRLHRMNTQRRAEPFVVVDVTSIPKDLLESELFGYEKGAFTGADRRKPGRLELANGGTLFIDEVADTPLGMQVKRLRAQQEKSFFRVGGTQAIHSDFRLVSATNRNIEEAVVRGTFREDLFYRLNVIQLIVPPLRNRRSDIILLARDFLEYYVKKYQWPGLSLKPEHEAILSRYPWPGNVRELRNVMERAVLLSAEGMLELVLPGKSNRVPDDPFSDSPAMDELQRRYIRHILEKSNGRIGGGPGGASEILGMKRTTLYTRMRRLGLK